MLRGDNHGHAAGIVKSHATAHASPKPFADLVIAAGDVRKHTHGVGTYGAGIGAADYDHVGRRRRCVKIGPRHGTRDGEPQSI